MITPNTNIKFLKVPFSPSQNHVLKFADLTAQVNYMNTKVVDSLASCSYQREGDGEFLRVNRSVDELYNCNYVMFQNANFMNRWFYAFIDRVEYKNPNVCHVHLNMDVYQSFQFDFTLQKSFIERQTFSTDYYNTLADTPSTGDLKTVFEYTKYLGGNFFILFNSDPTTEDSSVSTLNYPSIGYHSLPCYMAICNTASECSEIIQAVSNKGRADRIQSAFFAPGTVVFENVTTNSLSKGDLNITNNLTLVTSIAIADMLEDFTVTLEYTPTFKKEICYPYGKLELVDGITGKSVELDISKFSNPLIPDFRLLTTISDRCEYKIIPMNYNGEDYSIENALVIEPLTDMPIFSNSYAKYLKDNQTSNIINGVMSGVGLVGSIMTGNVMGAVGGFASIANVVNADHVAKSQPNQVTGIKGDTSEYLNLDGRVYFRLKVMDTNHMDIARNFWNAFGYPERKITTFSNTSQTFNFYKTEGCNIIADSIPSKYQRELENIFNKGVTIWNNNYLQYA